MVTGQQRLAAAGLVAGDEATTVAHGVGAGPHPVPGIQAPEAQAGDLLGRRAATTAMGGRSGRASRARATVPPPRLLESIGVEHRASIDAMDL